MEGRYILCFLAGAVVGSVATALFIRQYEAENGKLVMTNAEVMNSKPEDGKPILAERDSLSENPTPQKNVQYDKIIEDGGYSKKQPSVVEAAVSEGHDEPYRITEDAYFDDNVDGIYDVKQLTFFSDGVLADGVSDERIDGPDMLSMLGPNYQEDFLRAYFQELSNDMLFIRNDRLFEQYEIVGDMRTYKEVTGRD